MRDPLLHPWIDLCLGQLWIARQTSDTVARCIDSDLLRGRFASMGELRTPSAPRLNPLEFHGRRRTAARPTGGR